MQTFFEEARASWDAHHTESRRASRPRAEIAGTAAQCATTFLLIALARALELSFWQCSRDFGLWQASSGVSNKTHNLSPAGKEFAALLKFGLCECTPDQVRAVVPAIAGEMRGAS